MTERHVHDLEKRLERNHWRVLERFDRATYPQSTFWMIGRPDGREQHQVDFSTNPEMDAQTVNDSLGCQMKQMPKISAYFASGASWQDELSHFIAGLNEFAAARKEQKID